VSVASLLSRRLVILTGKGGVGKSVVGTALALHACDQGRKVLLVEVDSPFSAARFLGEPSVGGRETEVRPGLFMVNLDPAEVMREYVRETVRVDLIARKVLESPVYTRFFAAAPGLPELMVLGKIMVLEEARQGWGKEPLYDLVIVDAPATGHGLAFLKVPQAASNAVPVGPVGNNARRILSMLQDEKRTALAIVAIPEEMAVVEALELHRMVRDEVGMEASAVILNACHERRFSAAEEAEILSLRMEGADSRLAPGVGLAAALAAARRHIRRRKLTDFYKKRIRRALPLPLLTLPFLPEEALTAEAVRVLADRMAAA
jgi:anion-transporting  ArsA/GET3 family ATPase